MTEKFIRLYRYLTYAIFALVALGGAVRAMNAGLACPDWPLCFGDIIPDYHPQVYFEFIHRALAGVIGIVSVWLNVKIVRSSHYSPALKGLAIFTIILLLAQVVMGGLTVLLQLHEKVVALHLAMGTGFFALSLWISVTLQKIHSAEPAVDSEAQKGGKMSVFLLASVYGQILLGGLVASHYAALVCTDFPTCHGEMIPTFQGIIGLHVIHRLGAYLLTLIVIGYVTFIFKKTSSQILRRLAATALVVLFIQIAIGIANVVFLTPPLITVLHLATGTFLLGVAVRAVRASTQVGLAAKSG